MVNAAVEGRIRLDGVGFEMSTATVWRTLVVGDNCIVAIAGTNDSCGCVARFDKCAYSIDGIKWIEGTIYLNNWSDATYGNGRFVAVAGALNNNYRSNGAYSNDGINWQSMTMPTSAPWLSVEYGNGRFVAVGGTNIAL